MKRTRKSTWLLCLLAALLNLGGGPMAWAKAATADPATTEAATAALEMAPDCHQHATYAGDGPSDPADTRMPPCCESGACACMVPHGGPVAASLPLTVASVFHAVCSATTRDVPSTVIDDALRPPIR